MSAVCVYSIFFQGIFFAICICKHISHAWRTPYVLIMTRDYTSLSLNATQADRKFFPSVCVCIAVQYAEVALWKRQNLDVTWYGTWIENRSRMSPLIELRIVRKKRVWHISFNRMHIGAKFLLSVCKFWSLYLLIWSSKLMAPILIIEEFFFTWKFVICCFFIQWHRSWIDSKIGKKKRESDKIVIVTDFSGQINQWIDRFIVIICIMINIETKFWHNRRSIDEYIVWQMKFVWKNEYWSQ